MDRCLSWEDSHLYVQMSPMVWIPLGNTLYPGRERSEVSDSFKRQAAAAAEHFVKRRSTLSLGAQHHGLWELICMIP